MPPRPDRRLDALVEEVLPGRAIVRLAVRDPPRRQRHGLRFGDYFGGRYARDGATVGFVAMPEGSRLVIRSLEDTVIGEGWDELADRMATLPADTWHDFHVWREWPAEAAVAAGHPFAVEELLPVLSDLAVVYFDVVAARRA